MTSGGQESYTHCTGCEIRCWAVFGSACACGGKRVAPSGGQADEDESQALIDKLTDILTRTANALKGEPVPPVWAHSWHDLPEVAATLKASQPPPAPAWQTAAYLKDRTRRVIRERVAAGESHADVAADYAVPVPFVEALCAWQLFGDEPAPSSPACAFCKHMPPPMGICTDDLSASICEDCIRKFAAFTQPTSSALRAMIEAWRNEAQALRFNVGEQQRVSQLNHCAAELEALL